MLNIEGLKNLVNYHANTNIIMHGKIDSDGFYKGTIEGSTLEEIHEFLRYIAVTRGRDFNQINISYGRPNPHSFSCYIEFDVNEIQRKDGYIITICQSCGKLNQTHENYAGRQAICPYCDNSFVVGLITSNLIDYYKKSFDGNDKINFDTNPSIDISNIYFISSDHIRFNNDKWSGGNNKGCMRVIAIKPDTDYENSYFVTVYNLNDLHPFWGNNIQIAPKRMRIISSDEKHIILRGFGPDPMLANRPPQIQKNYGITIHLIKNDIDHISYYYYDRNVRIDFKK